MKTVKMTHKIVNFIKKMMCSFLVNIKLAV